MLVNAHLSQMRMFGIRQGVEFYPHQDNFGTQRFDFIQQGIGIPKSVWTYRGQAIRFEGDTCFYLDSHEPKYKRKADYAATAVAH